MTLKVKYVEDGIYHIYNRGIRKSEIYLSDQDHHRWLNLLYWCNNYNYSYSMYLHRLKQSDSDNTKQQLLEELELTNKYASPLVNILAHAEMDNHFHLILQQKAEAGITKFIHRLLTSYSKYFNLLNDYKGRLFESRFKSVHVKTDEQLLQLFRYVHLNPYAAGLVEKDNLLEYPWSSLATYLRRDKEEFLDMDFILKMFDYKRDRVWNFITGPIKEHATDEIAGLTIDDDFHWYVKRREQKKELQRNILNRLSA